MKICLLGERLDDVSSDESSVHQFFMNLAECRQGLRHPDPWNPDCLRLYALSVVGVRDSESPFNSVVAFGGDDVEGDRESGNLCLLAEQDKVVLLDICHGWLESFLSDVLKEDHEARKGVGWEVNF